MITLLTQLLRFLFTTLAGTALLAGVGVLFLIGSLAMMFSKPEVASKMSVADLEKATALPKPRYLELSNGHIAWHELRTLTVKRTKKSGETTSETTKMYYVPLVSKDSIVRMTKDGAKGLWSQDNVRAWMRVSPEELEKGLPTEAAGLKEPKAEWVLKEHTIAVEGRPLSSEDTAVREGLTKESPGQDADKVLIVRYNVKPPTKGDLVGGGICMMLLSVLLFVPLVICLVRRKQPAGPPALPGADEPRGGIDRAVRAGVEDAVRGAMRRAPEAVPAGPELQYWYMRGNDRHGPVPLSQLRALRRSGEVAGGDLVFPVGGKEWARADTIA